MSDRAFFKGIPFFVKAEELAGGHRLITHLYPKVDSPDIENMGRLPKRLPTTGYTIGPDYSVEKNRIIAAFDETEPGALDHPFFGRAMCYVEAYAVRRVSAEDRYCEFEVVFIPIQQLTVTKRAPAASLANVRRLRDVVNTAMSERFGTKLTGFLTRGYGQLKKAREFTSAILTGIENCREYVRQAEAFKAALRKFQGEVSDIILSPRELSRSLIDVLSFGTFVRGGQSLIADASNSRLQIDEYNSLRFLFPLSAYSAGNDDGKILRLVHNAILTASCALATVIRYSGKSEAVLIRDDLIARLDEAIIAETDGEITSALYDLKSATVASFQTMISSLPNYAMYTPPEPAPVALLAYALYGSTELSDDLSKRNGVRNPFYARSLEVIV